MFVPVDPSAPAPEPTPDPAPDPTPSDPPVDNTEEMRAFMNEYRADKKAAAEAAEAKAKADAEVEAKKKKIPAPEPKKKAAPKPVDPPAQDAPKVRSYGSARYFNRKPKRAKNDD